MANTYSQITYHIVFAVYERVNIILPTWRPELHAYIGGIAKKLGLKPYAVGGTASHVHIALGASPTYAPSDILNRLKSASSKWINEKGFCKCRFQWQKGSGIFSVSQRNLGALVDYINHQEEHHKVADFDDEMRRLLGNANIEYDEKYILNDPEK